MEKKKIELRDYQKECIEKIDNAEPGKYLVTLATGLGKCFAKGTEILMYNGEVKKVEDIREGDLVMGWDSTPRKVSGLSRGKEMMYRIERPKHDPYTVNESHVLSLKITGISSSYNKRVTDSLGRKFSRGDICSIKVSDYLKCSDYFKHIAKGFCASVDFKEQKIPVDPYFLGLWLGDGSSRALKITTQDAEVSDYLYDFAEKIGGSVKKSHSGNEGEADDYTISFGYKHTGIRKYFRETLFLNKHIPQEYLSNSEEIRLKLLAGLLDSDGYLHKQDHSTFEYSTRSEKMQKQAAFLCRTLGLTARCFKRFNKKYQRDYFYVCIFGDTYRIPTRVARKKALNTRKNKNNLVHGIEVIPVGIGDYYGFELSGPDRMFLLSDCTVVHNTVIFTHITRRGRVLILSHRDELVRQPVKYYDCPVGIEKADETADGEEVVSASVPSMSRDKRLMRYKPDDFDTIIVDEAHHATAASYKKILDYFKPRLLLGFTATPRRGDKKTLKDIFDSVLYEKNTKWGIRHHYLVDVRSYKVTAHLNLKTVRKTMGDYNEGALGQRILESDAVPVVAKAYMEYCRALHRRTLIFCVSVKVCEAVVDAVRSLLPENEKDRIRMISGSTPQEERNSISEMFLSGSIDCIVNCMVFTEGTDLPPVDAIINLRPTCNSLLYQQIVGRGLRTAPGKKDCLIFDIMDADKKEKKICTAPGLFGIDESILPDRMKKEIEDHALLSEMDEGIDEGIEAIKVSEQDIVLRAHEYDLFLNSLVGTYKKENKETTLKPGWHDRDGKGLVVSDSEDDIPEELSGLAVTVLPFEKEKYFIRFSNGSFTFSEPDILGNVRMKIDYKNETIADGEVSLLRGARAAKYFIIKHSDPGKMYLWSDKVRSQWKGVPATEKQVYLLKKLRQEPGAAIAALTDKEIEHLDKDSASELIDAVRTNKELSLSAEKVRKNHKDIGRNDKETLERLSSESDIRKSREEMLQKIIKEAESDDADDEEGTMSFLCHYIGDQRFRSFLVNDSISLKQYKFLMDLTETLRKSGGIFTKSWPSDMKVSTMDALVQFIRAVNQRLLFETGNETFIFDTDRILTDIETHNGEKKYTVTIKARKI